MKRFLAALFRAFGSLSETFYTVFSILRGVFPLITILAIVGFMGSCVGSCGTIATAGKGTSRSKGIDDESDKQVGKYFFYMYICFMTALVGGSMSVLLGVIMDEIDRNEIMKKK